MSTEILLILSAIFAFLSWKHPKVAMTTILLSTILGEFARVDLSIGLRGVLFMDIAMPLFVGIWVVKHWATHKSFPKWYGWWPLLFFSLINILAIITSPYINGIGEYINTISYFARLLSAIALVPILGEWTKEEPQLQNRGMLMFTLIGLLIACTGFIQLYLFPDFKEMAEIGWDPHINRLLGTWFDPNFLGGFLGMAAGLTLTATLKMHSQKQKLGYGAATVILVAALLLTYSRSGYLMFGVTAGIILLIHQRTLLVSMIVLILLAIPLSDRAQERIMDMYGSALSVLTPSYEHSLDATARFRVESWEQTISIIEEHPITGVGYNALKYARIEKGFEKDPRSHAASGADSSLLLLTATTGILGLVSFLWLYVLLLISTWKKRNDKGSAGIISTTVFASTLGLFVHSMFVNSLFFPPILLLFWFLVGIGQQSDQVVRTS